MSTCRSCGAEVIFVPSETTGKAMILDAKPEKRIVLVFKDSLSQLVPAPERMTDQHRSIEQPRARVLSVYTDHHVTCPDAASWKGKRREPADAH